MNWPERATVVRLTAKHATKIRKAFDASMNGDSITAKWIETHPAGGSVSPQMARDWALAHVISNKKPIDNALASIYADGYVLGEKVAKSRLLGLLKKDAVSTNVVDWANWIPGNASAAALVNPQGGLKQLLDSRKISIADDVVRTKLDRIGTALASSLERGFSASQTAKSINEIINDPQHAMVISRTEMARSMSVASRETYEANNVEQVEWLVADGCDICQENADASPLPIDSEFPSGDTEPPAHPNCECAIAPYFDDSALPEVPADATPVEDLITEEIPFEEVAPIELEPIVPEIPEVAPAYNEFLSIDELLNIGRDVPSMGNNAEDLWLNAIQEKMGFNELPKLVDNTEIYGLKKQGWIDVYRGIGNGGKKDVEFAQKAIQEFKTGQNFPGNGIYGNGTYTSNSIQTALGYGDNSMSNVMHIAISPEAKIIDISDLREMMTKELEEIAKSEGLKDFKELFAGEYRKKYEILSDRGRYAASKGFDAIKVNMLKEIGSREDYYVVLNRSKVAVVK